MKTKILSFAILFLILFSIENSSAQKKDSGQKANPQINTAQGDPTVFGALSTDGSYYSVCIGYIRLTGLGDATSAPAYLKIEGTADVCCLSPGQVERDPANCTPGQRLSATGEPVDVDVKNGSLVIRSSDMVCAKLEGGCKNKRNFEAKLDNVTIIKVILVVQGKEFNITSYL
jgi:hypothetical protein